MATYGSVSVGNTATLIVDANPQRLSLIITNSGATIYIGQDASVTASGCPFIVDGGNLTEDSGGTKMYCGPIYGITASGTSTALFWERIR
jgi:hypothetical protein